MHLFFEIVAWTIALLWLTRSIAAYRGLPTIPDLQLAGHDLMPEGRPTLTVIVPARNEGIDIRECLESLLAQDYDAITIMAVNDRSDDSTGQIMDELAVEQPTKLNVIHIDKLPGEWLGKTHAMAVAAAQATSEFLLFTDADVVFESSAIRRALANAVVTRADHLVLFPTTIIRRWDEAALLSIFQVFGLWAPRPWRVSDATAPDAIGIGAFNLVRRGAYEQVGGFEALRMEIVEDLGLGRRIKRAGLRQRIAFGRDLVSVHWASGVNGLVNVMTKNIFAAMNFRVPLVLVGCLWLAGFCIAPYVLVWIPAYTIPCSITIIAMGWGYFLVGKASGLSAWNALLAPFAAAVFGYTLLRSMLTTLRQGGVMWRGTFYPLAALKRHTSPLR